MSHQDLRTALGGVAFTTATPFDEGDESLRMDRYRENLAFLEDHGADVFVPCGNTGEYYALSHEERIEVVETTVDATADDATVIAGLAGSLKTATSLAAAYEAAGVDAVMVMDLDHTYIHIDGIVEYFGEVAAAVDCGVIGYKRSEKLSLPVIERIAEIEGVVGLKYAVNDVKGLSAAIERLPDEFVMVNGIAERFAPSFAVEGASGFTTGIGNFVPELSLALHDAIVAENWGEAIELRNLARPLEDLREETGGGGNHLPAANNVPTVKFGLDHVGQHGGPVRTPLRLLTSADQDRAMQYLEAIAAADLGTLRATPTESQ